MRMASEPKYIPVVCNLWNLWNLLVFIARQVKASPANQFMLLHFGARDKAYTTPAIALTSLQVFPTVTSFHLYRYTPAISRPSCSTWPLGIPN